MRRARKNFDEEDNLGPIFVSSSLHFIFGMCEEEISGIWLEHNSPFTECKLKLPSESDDVTWPSDKMVIYPIYSIRW